MGLTGNWYSRWSETLDRARAQTKEENEPGSPCITHRRRCSSQKDLETAWYNLPWKEEIHARNIGIGLNKIMTSTVLIYRLIIAPQFWCTNALLKIYYNRPKKMLGKHSWLCAFDIQPVIPLNTLLIVSSSCRACTTWVVGKKLPFETIIHMMMRL